MSVVKDFKMDYFLLKNALKGHNLVLFGSFSLPIQDFFGAIFYHKGIGFSVPTVLNWCFLSTKGKIGHFHMLLRHSNGQLSILPKLVLFVHRRENGVLLGYFRGKLDRHFILC